jgi:hypothetical protein
MIRSESQTDHLDAYGDLLGHQYYEMVGARRVSNGPRTLMFAVLEDGIRCYLSNMNATRPSRRQQFEEAEAWIEDRREVSPFSFETLCNVFEIDADKLRAQLDTMTARRLPRRLIGISRPSRPRPARVRRRCKRH